jgi:hypothetical protein
VTTPSGRPPTQKMAIYMAMSGHGGSVEDVRFDRDIDASREGPGMSGMVSRRELAMLSHTHSWRTTRHIGARESVCDMSDIPAVTVTSRIVIVDHG